ncbi:MAG: BMP family protein [Anaerolineales bacterium]
MKKRHFWLLVGAMLPVALVLAACAQTTPEAPAEEEAAPAEPFRVAVVMPSAFNDLAFSQSMFDALSKIQEEMGEENFEFVYSDGMFVVDDAAAAIRDYASQGYDLVISHGSQYGSSLVEIAPDFPDTSFAWGTTVDTFKEQGIDNIFAYTVVSDQGGYVGGVMAAMLTKSGKIGIIGPIPAGDGLRTVEGFAAGVRATSDIEPLVTFTGSFSDVALAAGAAQTDIDAGADVLTGTAQMVVGAIGVAQEQGVLWYGNQASQTSLAPDIVYANQVYDWTVALDPMIQSIKDGVRGGEVYLLTLENGGIFIEYNPDFDLPSDVKAAAEDTIQGIIDGSIETSLALPGEEEEAAPAEPFRVAVVMPSAFNDLAFSQSMFDALSKIQEEMGEENFEFVYSDGMFVVDDAAAAIRDYASQGYDLVISHGSQYGSSLVEIAPDFPDTSFAWGTTVDTFKEQGIDNIFAYTVVSDQGGYVGGVMAAMLTKSGKIGIIGPIPAGDGLRTVEGFAAGVRATSDIEPLVTFTGSFSDVALAAGAAQTDIDAGADVLTGTAQMVVGAIGVAQEQGVLWYGNQASQTSLAPDIVYANQVYDWTVALDPMIQSIKDGVRGGEVYLLTLENGGIFIEYNPDFDLPSDVKAAAEDTIQGIIDGSIETSLALPGE